MGRLSDRVCDGGYIAGADEPVILSADRNGELVFQTSTNYGSYTVEWSTAPDGPWSRSWESLQAMVAAGRSSITCSIPMFYRVSAVPAAPSAGMVWLAGGKREIRDPDLGVYHITVDPFFIDIYEVSAQLYNEVAGWSQTNGYSIGSTLTGANEPATQITWYEAVAWCNARSEMDGRTPCYTTFGGNTYRGGWDPVECDFESTGYRLPTSDEWEIAARGGNLTNRFSWGDTISHSNANYAANSSAYAYDVSSYTNYTYHPAYMSVSPVGSFEPNGVGVYDMAGNVTEWCWDRQGEERARRGGGWMSDAASVRCGTVSYQSPITVSLFENGFRTVTTDPR